MNISGDPAAIGTKIVHILAIVEIPLGVYKSSSVSLFARLQEKGQFYFSMIPSQKRGRKLET